MTQSQSRDLFPVNFRFTSCQRLRNKHGPKIKGGRFNIKASNGETKATLASFGRTSLGLKGELILRNPSEHLLGRAAAPPPTVMVFIWRRLYCLSHHEVRPLTSANC